MVISGLLSHFFAEKPPGPLNWAVNAPTKTYLYLQVFYKNGKLIRMIQMLECYRHRARTVGATIIRTARVFPCKQVMQD